MNWGEILVANGTGLCLLIILIICRHMTKLTRRPVDKVFSAIIAVGIAGTVLEPFTFFIDGRGGGVFQGALRICKHLGVFLRCYRRGALDMVCRSVP